jgi:hypothetical protein
MPEKLSIKRKQRGKAGLVKLHELCVTATPKGGERGRGRGRK